MPHLRHRFFMGFRGPKAHSNRPHKTMVCPTEEIALPRGFARDQDGIDQYGLGGDLALGADGFDQHAGGLLSDGGAALVDGGEWNAQQVGVVDVAGADDFDLPRDGDAGFEDGFHGAGGGGVVVTEDGVGTGLERQQAAGGEISAGIVGGMHDIGIREGEAGGGEDILVAFLTADSGSERRPGDMGDAAAPALDQVAGGEAAYGFVVGADIGSAGPGEAPVDQDVGDAAGFDAFEEAERRRRLGRGEQQTIHLARQQAVHFAALQRAVLFGIADHDVVAQRADSGGDALGDLGEEGVHQIGNDHSDHEGAARRETARHPVGLVVELLDAGQHPAARFRADIGASPDYLGNGHHADVEIARDVLQAYRRGGSVSHGDVNASIPSCGAYRGRLLEWTSVAGW